MAINLTPWLSNSRRLARQSSIDRPNLSSFQQTVTLSEVRTKAGDMSEGDLLKIKLQTLQFQTDVSAAKLAKLQALAMLRQLIGFESVPENYDVEGKLDYQPIHGGIAELKATVADGRGAYGEAPAFRRLMNDVERLSIDASELDTVAPAAAPPPTVRIPIDDSPPDPAMWTDADDEGVGGHSRS